jgi:hypothetical protein
MITRENHSTEYLRSIFETAFFDCIVDKDGDLIVSSGFRVIVKSNPTFVQLIAVFPCKKGSSWLILLETINKMNLELNTPRAYALTDSFEHALVLDYTLAIGEGITAKALVETLRFYESLIRTALPYYEGLLR